MYDVICISFKISITSNLCNVSFLQNYILKFWYLCIYTYLITILMRAHFVVKLLKSKLRNGKRKY